MNIAESHNTFYNLAESFNLYLYMKEPFRYWNLGYAERWEGVIVGEWGKQSTAFVILIFWGYESNGFLSKKMSFWCIPLSINPVQSLTRSAEKFTYWFIPQTFIENLPCPEFEREGMRATPSSWTFMENEHAQLCQTWSVSTCLLPAEYHTPLSPVRYLKRGNKRWVLWPQVDVQPTSSLVCHLHERRKWGPFMQSHRAGRPEPGI